MPTLPGSVFSAWQFSRPQKTLWDVLILLPTLPQDADTGGLKSDSGSVLHCWAVYVSDMGGLGCRGEAGTGLGELAGCRREAGAGLGKLARCRVTRQLCPHWEN